MVIDLRGMPRVYKQFAAARAHALRIGYVDADRKIENASGMRSGAFNGACAIEHLINFRHRVLAAAGYVLPQRNKSAAQRKR